MTRLKDICLQVRSEGMPDSLKHEFFEPVAAISCKYRVCLTSLRRESLLPLSLGLSQFLASGRRVQLLIVPAAPASLPDSVSSASVTPEGKPWADLLAQLAPLAAAVEGHGAHDSSTLCV